MMIATNRQKIAALISRLFTKVPPDELIDVVIFGSSAITLNGKDLERPVDDLDLFASDRAYDELKIKHATEEVQRSAGVVALHVGIPKIEIWKTFPGVMYADVRQRAFRMAESQGLLVAALEDLCTWKRAQGRPKDLDDLKKMEC